MYSDKILQTPYHSFYIKVCDTISSVSEPENGVLYCEAKSHNIYYNINGVWELVSSSNDISYKNTEENYIKSIETIKCPNCNAPLQIFTKGYHNCPYCNNTIYIS